jgi:hypothetical protein
MNFLESKLFFAAAPVSIRKFDKYKKECPEVYQRTSMYMIVKRAVPSIRVVNNGELSDFLEIRGIKERDNKEFAKKLEMYIRDGKAPALDIVQSCSNKRLKGVYKYPKDIFTNHSISLRQDVEFEEIMYYSSQGMGTFWASGDIIPFLTYEVMYPFLFSDRKSILNMIFMSELDDDKMAMRPLSKLTRDILRQDKYY